MFEVLEGDAMFTSPGHDAGAGSAISGLSSKHEAFQTLQQIAFRALEHTAFPKRPLRVRGELIELGDLCSQLTGSLIELAMQGGLARVERYPFTLLPVRSTR